MANWIEPIFDRTYADVDFAIRQIEAWKNTHTHAADIAVTTDALVVNDVGVVTNPDSVVVNVDHARVENGVLVVEMGNVYDLKGCLNLADIFRIETNLTYISEQLNKYHYPIYVSSKEWVRGDLPTADDMKRIANNIRDIFSEFHTPIGSYEVSDVLLSYEDVNALEYNLFLLKEMLDTMVASFIPSGTTKCGARRLPLRR